jgi:multidrug resistance efflux pump
MNNTMKFNRTLIAVSILMIAASCHQKEEVRKPVVKPLMEAVYASGFIVSKDEYEVISQVEGYVSDKLVEDGDEVKKGEPLFVISSDQQNARNSIARETYELAVKNSRDDAPVLGELSAALESAKSKMLYDSANFIRYSNLIKQKATAQAEFDRIHLAFQNSQNDYLLQKSRYEKTRNQLMLELESARNNLIISSDESGRYIVRSEIEGRVFMTAKDKGELIKRNETIAILGKHNAYYLQLDIDELDINRIKENQQVMVKVDAYPNKVFKAHVTKIYPMVDRKQQAVRVDAALDEALPGLFSRLALEANIIIQKKDNAIVIPKNALLPGDSVLIETEDGERKIKVVKGIETLDEVEILEGLDSSKLLVLK